MLKHAAVHEVEEDEHITLDELNVRAEEAFKNQKLPTMSLHHSLLHLVCSAAVVGKGLYTATTNLKHIRTCEPDDVDLESMPNYLRCVRARGVCAARVRRGFRFYAAHNNAIVRARSMDFCRITSTRHPHRANWLRAVSSALCLCACRYMANTITDVRHRVQCMNAGLASSSDFYVAMSTSEREEMAHMHVLQVRVRLFCWVLFSFLPFFSPIHLLHFLPSNSAAGAQHDAPR